MRIHDVNLLRRHCDELATDAKKGAVMLKTTAAAVMFSAAVAAAITIVSAPTTHVDASPLPQVAAEPMHACAHRPWPYLRCVGTPLGNPHVRLVTTDRLDAR